MGDLLIQYLQKSQLINQSTNKLINYLIVPIPLHSKRRRERGFNQAELLAKTISENLGLLPTNALERTKNTKAQAKLKKSECREENVAGCFKIKNPESVRDKNIILVDDVFTSGATMNEAVKILKENGAKRIIALVAAKAW